MSKQQTNVRIPAAERSWLEEQAQRTGLSVSDVVRLSIRRAMASGALLATAAHEFTHADLNSDRQSHPI